MRSRSADSDILPEDDFALLVSSPRGTLKTGESVRITRIAERSFAIP